LDICDDQAVAQTLARVKADWIVNAAAYTAVDLAETHVKEAVAVNDIAVGSLVRAASHTGSRLLHLSTDYVFDGTANRAYLASDPAHPISIYGKTKLGGELHVLGCGAGIVLRTSWVYSASGKNFVLTMLRLLREREQVSVVCDQIGTPTWVGSIAAAVWGLLAANAAPGIYHWSDLGVASWYDFAVAIQDEAVVRRILPSAVSIIPIQTNAYPTPAKRPAFSVLDTRETRSLIGVQSRHWRHNLRVMLDEL
jgi:dTDP-4-dehydrorhamnose reductase